MFPGGLVAAMLAHAAPKPPVHGGMCMPGDTCRSETPEQAPEQARAPMPAEPVATVQEARDTWTHITVKSDGSPRHGYFLRVERPPRVEP